MRKRLFSAFVCVLMIMSLIPSMAFADGTGTAIYTGGLCEHHPQHNDACGYIAATEEVPCSHEHTEDCYVSVTNCVHEHTEGCYSEGSTEPICGHMCSEETDCITKELNCQHEHDENCGYAPATEGTPCSYVCEICNAPAAEEPKCVCDTKCAEGEVNEDCPVCGGENGDISSCLGKEEEKAECICSTKCAEGEINADCPVCGGENGDITACLGKEEEKAECICSTKCAEGEINADCPVCGGENGDISSCVGAMMLSTPPSTRAITPSKPSGEGTEANPYQIGTKEQLYWFAGLVNGTLTDGTEQNKAACAELTDDITVNTDVLGDDGNLNETKKDSFDAWTPIGSDTCPYTGTFNGKNHTISGLYFNDSSVNYVGLFGYVGKDGKIQNVGVVDSYISGSSNVGGVCGHNNGGTIESCYNAGTVTGTNTIFGNVGGVCGGNSYGTIENCYNTGSVTGNYVGGVCGYNYYYGTITSCYNTGTVSGDNNVGGVCGGNSYGTIENCWNTGAVSGKYNVGGVSGYNSGGTIKNCYNTGTVSGNEKIGGVCGFNSSYDTITNCYNIGKVNASGSNVGGVCGLNYGTITNCYNTGDVSGDENVGGVSGENSYGTITNCYNTGDVSGDENVGSVSGYNEGSTIKNCYNTGEVSGSDYVGGVCGNNASGTIENCYFLSRTATGGIGSGSGGTELSEYAFGVQGSFKDWLFTGDNAIWEMNVPLGRPILRSTPEEYDKNLGTGTKDTPYLISKAGQLAAFASVVNSGEPDIHAKLMNNIVIQTDVLENYNKPGNTLEQWTPIGSIGNEYTGTFDGNGHTISGLYVKEGISYIGLFDCVGKGGVIQNVGVVDSYISGDKNVGGVCGQNNGGTIENCYNTGTVTGTGFDFRNVGGVCGFNYGTIKNCYNTGDVSGGSYVGGVCGENNGGSIENCYNTGDVSGGSYVGGVCGYDNDGNIENCYNIGKVNASGSSVGGVCGQNASGRIENCYNTGDVSGEFNAGGVCGLKNDGRIENCYNTGDVSGGSYVGGVCGQNNGTIENCYFLLGTADEGVGSGSSTANKVEKKENTVFASGEVAWLLNDGQTEKPWGQDLGTEQTPRLYVGAEVGRYAVVRVLVHFPEGVGDISCYTNKDSILSAYPSGVNGKNYIFYKDNNFQTPIDTATMTYEEDTDIYAKTKKSSSSSAPTEYNLRFDTNGGEPMSTTVEQANTPIDLDQYVPTREGYEFAGWYADEALTKPIDTITLTESATIYAKWEKIEEEIEEEEEIIEEEQEEILSFSDVRRGDWFYEAVYYAVSHDLMSGMGGGIFSPNTPLQREMFAVILWNLEGNPAPEDVAKFLDVTSDKYYAEAIAWANENGIVAGYGDTFGVGLPITREQFAVMLHNYAQYKGYDVSVGEDTNILSYPDALEISEYAFSAMQWACGAGILGGNDDGTLNPQGQATRAEAATMLMNFCENIK